MAPRCKTFGDIEKSNFNELEYKIEIHPWKCEIDKTSNLYEKIYGCLDHCFRTLSEEWPTQIKDWSTELFIKTIEREICIPIQFLKIEIVKNPLDYSLRILIAITIDQNKIDNYDYDRVLNAINELKVSL